MAITKRSNLGAQAGATSVIAIHPDPHRSAPESLIGKSAKPRRRVCLPYDSTKQRARSLLNAHFSDDGQSQRALREIRQARF
jgi:hypothetical protein